MKRNLTWMGIIIALVFGLALFSACSENKTAVKEGAAQEKPAAAAQAATAPEQSAKVAPAAAAEATVANIYFDFDKSNIRPDAREILKTNAEIFMKNGNSPIVIEGNCDERGTVEYNLALGERRAREAKKYLANMGVKESRMKTVSYGKERPIDPGHNEEAWAKNRNAHFVVTAK
jgi:peptidoglycan-associated lipoprotein